MRPDAPDDLLRASSRGLGLLRPARFCCSVPRFLCVRLRHEFAVFRCTVEASVFVIDVGACVNPDQSLCLRISNLLGRWRGRAIGIFAGVGRGGLSIAGLGSLGRVGANR